MVHKHKHSVHRCRRHGAHIAISFEGPTAMAKYVLFNFWKSSCSWRVRTALLWKGVAFEYRAVDLRRPGGGEQHQEEFRKLNPNQRVPALVVDGRTLAQSGAILEFLEEAHPEKPLLPADLFMRAQSGGHRQGTLGCDIYPYEDWILMRSNDKDQKVAAWAKFWIERGFKALEEELTRCAGRYCVGDDVTMADVYLLPQVYNGRAVQVDIAAYPTIARVAAALEQLPAFVSAQPSNQPDAVSS
ncbi:hypothetical protein BBJ28_00016723 [Nothophytophthora sp. Chile5]|nr:hypothetical protein BBJ28_00016723 [Nothophytophthora sp. Chile5]